MNIDNHQIRPWTITWRGETWTDDNAGLTAGDVCRLQVLVGESWASVNPWASPLHLASMIAVLASRSSGSDALEMLAAVNETPAEEFLGAIGPRVELKAA
jgi:hypothetical protein